MYYQTKKSWVSGLTLMEMMVALALVSSLLAGALTVLQRTQSALSTVKSNVESEVSLDGALQSVATEFGRRANLANAVNTTVSGQPNQVSGCNGLGIIQRYLNLVTNLDNYRLVYIYSICSSGKPFWSANSDLLNVTGWSCPTGTIPKTQVMRWNTGVTATTTPPSGISPLVINYPDLQTPSKAVLICFFDYPGGSAPTTGVVAKGGGGSSNRSGGARLFQKQLYYTFSDRNLAVEIQ